MSALIRFISRKRSGGVAYRDQQVAGDRVRLGRSTDSEAHLNDPRVSLYQAVIEWRGNAAFVEAVAGGDVSVNDVIAETQRLKTGDVVGIGPYRVTMVEPPSGHAMAMTVELARPMGDDVQKLIARSRLSLAETRLSRRLVSWALSILVLALFLAWPLAAFFNPAREADTDLNKNHFWRADLSWNPGAISTAHQPIAQQCNRCHQQAFIMVRDEACVACHEAIQNHADPQKFKFAELTGDRCEHCHKEHYGNPQITRRDQVFCASCHAPFREKAPTSALLAAGDFGKDHPEFRPTVVVDPRAPRFNRVSLAATPRPRENSGIVFPHDKHLRPNGIRGPERMETLDCGSCHAVEPGGALMAPVTMEVHCQRCHELAFEPLSQGRRLPHGNVDAALRTIREYYADVALRGGFPDPTAPEIVRRRPADRQPLSKAQEREALAWADQRAQQAAQFVFTSKAVCGTCHLTTAGGEGGGRRYDVVKPRIAERWLPKGAFRHAPHATETCQRCHALEVTDPEKYFARVKEAAPLFAEGLLAIGGDDPALNALKAAARSLKDRPWSPDLAETVLGMAAVVATEDLPKADGVMRARRLAEDVIGAAWSDESSDILLPGIDSCRECHAGDSGFSWFRRSNRMVSDCVTCHYFHTPGQSPMRPGPTGEEVAKVPGQYRGGGSLRDMSIKAIHSGIRSPQRQQP